MTFNDFGNLASIISLFLSVFSLLLSFAIVIKVYNITFSKKSIITQSITGDHNSQKAKS